MNGRNVIIDMPHPKTTDRLFWHSCIDGLPIKIITIFMITPLRMCLHLMNARAADTQEYTQLDTSAITRWRRIFQVPLKEENIIECFPFVPDSMFNNIF